MRVLCWTGCPFINVVLVFIACIRTEGEKRCKCHVICYQSWKHHATSFNDNAKCKGKGRGIEEKTNREWTVCFERLSERSFLLLIGYLKLF